MTVSTNYTPLSYSGDDSTTVFSVTWPFFDETLIVTLIDSEENETIKTITTHYTVSGGTDSDGLPSTGSVTMLTAPATGETLQISRLTPKIQSATWTNGGGFQAKTLESAMDRLTLAAQETYSTADDAAAAAISAAAAIAAYDDFDDIYLGAKASDPSVDNDGDALQDGALYWNTTSNEMRVYDSVGMSWTALGTVASVNGETGVVTLDATDVDVSALSPSNYTAANASIEGHLSGIDTALASAGSGSGLEPVTSRTALKALDTSTYTHAYLSEAYREGIFVFRSGNYSASVTADTEEGIYIKADDTAASSGAWVRIVKDTVSVTWFGAVGDDSTDCIDGFQAAIDSGFDVWVPAGTYRCSDTIEMNNVGQALYGQNGGNNSQIHAYHTNGPVIRVSQRQCRVSDLYIDASTTRRAAAVTSGNHGILLGGSGSGSLTYTKIERCIVTAQPCDGFVFNQYGYQTIFEQCSAQYNRGHGFRIDDGTSDGLSASQNGMVLLQYCKALMNGGNGLNIGESGLNGFRIEVRNFEAPDNAWNTSISGLDDYQLRIASDNTRIVDIAVGDANYASTTMPNSESRSAKSAKGDGIFLSGNCSDVIIENVRCVSITNGVYIGSNAIGIRLSNLVAVTAVNVMVDAGSNVDLKLDLASATNITTTIDSETDKNVMTLGGETWWTIAGTSYMFNLNGYDENAIVSGFLNCWASHVIVTGEGGVADDLVNIGIAGSTAFHPDGTVIYVTNLSAYTITIKDGTGNIQTHTGADVALTQYETVTFLKTGGGSPVYVVNG